MVNANVRDYGDERYLTRLAAAYVRGKLGRLAPQLSSEELIAAGLASGLRLHKFKRNTELPRVRKDPLTDVFTTPERLAFHYLPTEDQKTL